MVATSDYLFRHSMTALRDAPSDPCYGRVGVDEGEELESDVVPDVTPLFDVMDPAPPGKVRFHAERLSSRDANSEFSKQLAARRHVDRGAAMADLRRSAAMRSEFRKGTLEPSKS